MGIEWRPLRPSDVRAAFELSKIAGWNQTEADWLGYLALDPAGCLAAQVDGQLVGTATSIRYGDRVGWIGMVLVHPGFRRQGIGRELLDRTIKFLLGMGTKTIRLDATSMGRQVYLPLGFRDEFVVTRLEGRIPDNLDGKPIDPCDKGPRPMRKDDLAQMAMLDAKAFGVGRGEVLAALSSRAPNLCFVMPSNSGIRGYLIAREGREAVQLGPMVASSALMGEQLFQGLFAVTSGRRLFLDLPVPNQLGSAILARYGFKEQRSFTRMILGQDGPVDNLGFIYGTSGAEMG